MKRPKRPKDVCQRAKLIADMATGEVRNDSFDAMNPSVIESFGLSGHKGGVARANKLTAEKRSAIAKNAAQKRWDAKK